MRAEPTADCEQRFLPNILCGLRNLGNTCYFNAGLQLLANVSPFVTALTYASPFATPESDERHSSLHPSHSGGRRRLFQTTTTTLDEMQSGQSLTVAPRAMLQQFADLNTMFAGLHQQDCPEMLTMLLSQLEDETKIDVQVAAVRSELRGSSPKHPPSARFMRMIDVLEGIHKQNAEEDVAEKQARGLTTSTVDDYRAPHTTRHAVNDCFRGQMLHEIVCHECRHVSRTADEFTSLTLEIPTRKQRIAHQATSPYRPRLDAQGMLLNPINEDPRHKRRGYAWWNPVRYVAAFLGALYACCFGDDGVGHALTLEECLDIHFNDEVLTGANKYLCGKCRRRTNATKHHSVLWYPEYLTLHLKRFESGSYWTWKRNDNVIFPMGSPALTSAMGRKLDMSVYGAEALAQFPALAAYQLVGVVNHHGGYGSGHYTAFTYKEEVGWVLCDDERVTRVREEDVAESQEYVLMYRKVQPNETSLVTSDIEMADAHRRWKLLSQSYLVNSVAKLPVPRPVYVSRFWLHRVATFAEPGPLLNRVCYCRPEQATQQHFHGSVASAFVPVSYDDFCGLVDFYGGDAEKPMTAEARKALLRLEEQAMRSKASSP